MQAATFADPDEELQDPEECVSVHECWFVQACLNTLRAGLIAGTGGRFAIDPILGGFGALQGVC